MSLPPERLSIKRRRDEDPVDCLYLQQKRIKSDFIYTRVTSSSSVNHDASLSQSPKSPNMLSPTRHHLSTPQAPTVKATQPGSEFDTRTQGKLTLIEKAAPDGQSLPINAAKSNGRLQGLQRPLTPARTRRFHLTTSAVLSASRVDAGYGISKHKSKVTNRLPVFIEESAKAILFQTVSSDPAMQQCDLTSLKQPTTTDDRITRRNTTRTAAGGLHQPDMKLADISGSVGSQVHIDDTESLAATEEALGTISQTAQDSGAPTELQSKWNDGQSNSAARTQRNRLPDRADGESQLMIAEVAMTDDGSYVYDTYVRAEGNSQNIARDICNRQQGHPPTMQADQVGVLVIDDKDEQNWQEFLEDAVCEKDWDTDEEDENAEDYYGNDYPEDELDSDDEFERNAYRYEIDASSEDGDSIDRSDCGSDDESMRSPHWKGSAGVQSLRIFDDSD